MPRSRASASTRSSQRFSRRSSSCEVVVVDDGSEDETPELLRGYGDRITAVTHDAADRVRRRLQRRRGGGVRRLRRLPEQRHRHRGGLARRRWSTTRPRTRRRRSSGPGSSTRTGRSSTPAWSSATTTCPRHIYRCFPADHPAVTHVAAATGRSPPPACSSAERLRDARRVRHRLQERLRGRRPLPPGLARRATRSTTATRASSSTTRPPPGRRAASTRATGRTWSCGVERWGTLPRRRPRRYVEDGLLRARAQRRLPAGLPHLAELASTPDGPVDDAVRAARPSARDRSSSCSGRTRPCARGSATSARQRACSIANDGCRREGSRPILPPARALLGLADLRGLACRGRLLGAPAGDAAVPGHGPGVRARSPRPSLLYAVHHCRSAAGAGIASCCSAGDRTPAEGRLRADRRRLHGEHRAAGPRRRAPARLPARGADRRPSSRDPRHDRRGALPRRRGARRAFRRS